MILTKTFINSSQNVIKLFLKDEKLNYHQLITKKQDHLSIRPRDFNFGYHLGFIEGVLSTQFNFENNRKMNPQENLELRKLITKKLPVYKKLIFSYIT